MNSNRPSRTFLPIWDVATTALEVGGDWAGCAPLAEAFAVGVLVAEDDALALTQAAAQVVELGLRDVDAEGSELL